MSDKYIYSPPKTKRLLKKLENEVLNYVIGMKLTEKNLKMIANAIDFLEAIEEVEEEIYEEERQYRGKGDSPGR